MIAIPAAATELIVQLSLPKQFPTERGKVIMESKAQLASRGVASPDQAEALSLTFEESAAAVVPIMPYFDTTPLPDPWACRH